MSVRRTADQDGMSRLREETPSVRWVCPVCEESRTKVVGPGKNRLHVVNDLKSHIRTVGGGGHGPTGAYPDEVDVGSLQTHLDG